MEQLASKEATVVLSPHFSAIVSNSLSPEINYFIVGQAPMGGGTTLQSVLKDGTNSNLGPGQDPHLATVLQAIRVRLASPT
jgi:hypothetical protein